MPWSDSGWTTLIDGSAGMGNFSPIGDANWRAQDGPSSPTRARADISSRIIPTRTSNQGGVLADHTTNSGIFLRCADRTKVGAVACYEVNIYDQRPEPEYGTGAIVNVAKVSPMPKAGGKWNTYEITAKGSQLTVVLNGVQTVDVRDGKHAEGPFALQFGNGPGRPRRRHQVAQGADQVAVARSRRYFLQELEQPRWSGLLRLSSGKTSQYSERGRHSSRYLAAEVACDASRPGMTSAGSPSAACPRAPHPARYRGRRACGYISVTSPLYLPASSFA